MRRSSVQCEYQALDQIRLLPVIQRLIDQHCGRLMASKIIAGIPEAIIPHSLEFMITGVLGCCIASQFGGFGVLTFVQVATLGFSAASLEEYQTDRGLWMLAILMLVIWGGLYALGLVMQIFDMHRGVQSPISVLIDTSLATFCTTIHLRFLWRIAHYNFQHVS